MGGSVEQARARLYERLRRRRVEIEEATLARVSSVSDPAEIGDPEYLEGLRTAVGAAIEYGLAALDRGEVYAPQVPPILLAQARLAARSAVSLDTVLRRYFAGYTLFGDFLVDEATRVGLHGPTLQRLLAVQAAQLDHLAEAVSEEHTREREGRFRSKEQRQAERVRRMLAGEPLGSDDLGYDMDVWHVAGIGIGRELPEVLRSLGEALGSRLLLVYPGDEVVWAWLGSREDSSDALFERARGFAVGSPLAFGEPAQGVAGWRFSHRQAKAALPIAERRGGEVVRYADVCLLASVMRDDVLVSSLRRLYLEPLEDRRGGGETLRQTLRAYFAAGRNVSSAAEALGVHRDTVAARLRLVDQEIGRPLSSFTAELEVALGVEALSDGGADHSAIRR